jgi:hypothetical protein
MRRVLNQCEACAIEQSSVASGPRGTCAILAASFIGQGAEVLLGRAGARGYWTRVSFIAGPWGVLMLSVPSFWNS